MESALVRLSVSSLCWNLIYHNKYSLKPTLDKSRSVFSCHPSLLVGFCSFLKVFGFGTWQRVRATLFFWLMGTVFSLSCCTVASSKSPEQRRVRFPTRVKGHARSLPAGPRVIQSDPHSCLSAWRFVQSKHVRSKGHLLIFGALLLLHFSNIIYIWLWWNINKG